VGGHQFLDAVLPDDLDVHQLWDGRGGNGELPQDLELQIKNPADFAKAQPLIQQSDSAG
jgi:hypothetical protein